MGSMTYSQLGGHDWMTDDTPRTWHTWHSVTDFFEDMAYFFNFLTCANLKAVTVYFLDNMSISISFDHVMLAFTIFALFGRDIEVLAKNPSADVYFDVLYDITFVLFLFELVASSLAKTKFFATAPFYQGYVFSFYWWLDLVSLLSLFPDVSWIANRTGLGDLVNSFGGSNSNLVKGGRVLRLVRLVRLLRIYKIASERRRRKKKEEEMILYAELGFVDYEDVLKHQQLNDHRGSLLGSQLSESITRKVVVLILVIIVVLPLLTYPSVDESIHFASVAVQTFNLALAQDPALNASMLALLDVVIGGTDLDSDRYNYLLQLSAVPYASSPGLLYNQESRLHATPARFIRTVDLTTNLGTVYQTKASYSRIYYAMMDSQLNIALTVVIAGVMIAGALIFTADAERLVLQPIERMMNMVEAVAANPLAPMSFAHRGHSGKRESMVSVHSAASGREKRKKSRRRSSSTVGDNAEHNQEGDYEIRLLETTIEKVTSLLRVGFGEAGAGIISHNLSSLDRNAMINPLLPGVRVYAIFGFCDIHRFEEATQKLGREVLTFVNTIADIVHSQVHAWGGQCNKNLGQAFVIVWRIGDENALIAANSASILSRSQQPGRASVAAPGERPETPYRKPGKVEFMLSSASQHHFDWEDDESKSQTSELPGFPSRPTASRAVNVDLRRVPGVDEIADKALIGYLKVIAELNRSTKIAKFRRDERLKSGVTAVQTPSASPASSPRPRPLSMELPVSRGRRGSFLYHQERRTYYQNLLLKSAQPSEDFTVRMGFGLHAGWAIEGAVGSIYKVDATYLSPHVNMAARLETTCKQYNVSMLMSHNFHELLSAEVQPKCRQVDRVTVKGSEVPIGVFTFDTLQDQFFSIKTQEQDTFAQGLMMLMAKGHRPSVQIQKIMRRKSDATEARHQLSLTRPAGPGALGGDMAPRSPKDRGSPPTLLLEGLDPALPRKSGPFGSAASPLDDRGSSRNNSPSGSRSSTPTKRRGSSTAPPPLIETVFQKRYSFFEGGSGAQPVVSKPRSTLAALFPPLHLSESGSEASPMDSRRSGRALPLLPQPPSLLVPAAQSTALSAAPFPPVSPLPPSPPPPPPSPSPSMSGKLLRSALTNGELVLDPLGPFAPRKQSTSSLSEGSIRTRARALEAHLLQRRSGAAMSKSGSMSSSEPALPRIPLPAMGAHHSARTRLLLSSVHKELVRGHRSYLRKMEAARTYRDENAEFAAAMGCLAHIFPEAEIIEPPFFNTAAVFERDLDLLQLQIHVKGVFLDTFQQGLSEYFKGNWPKARTLLLRSDRIMCETLAEFQETALYKRSSVDPLIGDGPSQTLLKYMQSFGFKAPADWRGYRSLTSK